MEKVSAARGGYYNCDGLQNCEAEVIFIVGPLELIKTARCYSCMH